jgi:hypothetical protein
MVLIGKYSDIESTISRVFTVNAIKGPVLKFFKTYTTITTKDTAAVSVWFEDIPNFLSGHITVQFDCNSLRCVGVNASTLDDFEEANFSQLLFPERDSVFYAGINTGGVIDVDMSILTTALSKSKTLSGSGSVLDLHFVPKKSGTSQLSIVANSTRLKNYEGTVINLLSYKDATIQVNSIEK